eukprot:1157872-Pelagomonas_calceolata.AAC.1
MENKQHEILSQHFKHEHMTQTLLVLGHHPGLSSPVKAIQDNVPLNSVPITRGWPTARESG